MIRERDGGIELDVLAQPRASKNRLGPLHDRRLKIAVTAPPVDGAANAAVAEVIADALGVSKSRVAVIRGHSSKRKTLRVEGVSAAAIRELADR